MFGFPAQIMVRVVLSNVLVIGFLAGWFFLVLLIRRLTLGLGVRVCFVGAADRRRCYSDQRVPIMTRLLG